MGFGMTVIVAGFTAMEGDDSAAAGAALFSFLLSWSQYLSTLIIGGGKMLTLPILLFSLMDSGDRPVAAAVSLVFILPALLALMGSAHNLGRRGLKGVR